MTTDANVSALTPAERESLSFLQAYEYDVVCGAVEDGEECPECAGLYGLVERGLAVIVNEPGRVVRVELIGGAA